MNENLRKLYVNDLNELFNQIDKPLAKIDNIQFATMAHYLLEDMLGICLDRRGQSIDGEPVGYALDSSSPDTKIVVEYSRSKTYFTDSNLTKIDNDINHCLDVAYDCEQIYLISNQTAGPLVYSDYSDYANVKSKELNKKITILDARKLSEYIVDEIIANQKTVILDKLIPYLPIIKKLNDEYLFTNTLPKNKNNFIERVDNKKAILDLLEDNKYILLHGISGIGKTEIAKDIANSFISEYSVIWLDGNTLNSPEDLKSITINRYNVSQNVIGLINNSKVFLVIDDLNSNIYELLDYINSNVDLNFKLIITSQIDEKKVDSKVKVDFAPEGISKNILNFELEELCSEEIFLKIDGKIGGHPFLLTQINILIKEEDLVWREVERELDKLVFSETENQKTFYNSLFEKHLNALGESLTCLKWINSKKIDASLLKCLIGVTGVKKLEKRSFFNIQNGFTNTLHDLVFDSLNHLTLTYDENSFIIKFKEELSKWYLEYSQNYFRVIYLHFDLISRLLTPNKYDVFSYSYINALPISSFNNIIIRNYSKDDIKEIFNNYSENRYFELFTWIELIEKEYLYKKETLSKEELSTFLIDKIEQIEKYLKNSNLLPEVYIEVQNHLAKFYRNSGNKEKSIELFEDIISKQNDYWVAKLHLSKLIRFENDRKKEAEKLIQDILEAFKNGQEVSSTVVLAAYIEIRSYKKLEEIYLIDLIENFQELINSVLVDKFDMPYQTLSALSSRIQFKYPDKMVKMTEELPIPSEESVKKNILFDIGQIYFNTSKAYFDLSNPDNAIKNANIAKQYFDKMDYKNDYQKRMIAENYLLLEKEQKAILLLDEVDKGKREIWWKYTYAKALSLSGNHDDALTLISECIDEASYSQDTFYRERANIKTRACMNPCDDLKKAHELCDDEKFKDMIMKEIIQNKC